MTAETTIKTALKRAIKKQFDKELKLNPDMTEKEIRDIYVSYLQYLGTPQPNLTAFDFFVNVKN